MKIVPVPIGDIQVEKSGEPRKTPAFLSLSLVASAWLANEIALAWIHERVPRDSPPLPDLWFSIFPEVTGAIRITEAIMLTIIVSAVIVIVCHQHRWIVTRRVFFCVALCYTFRAICITIFQVPVPSVQTYCAPKTDGSLQVIVKRVLKIAWSAGIEELRARELCGDLIISGHTISLFNAVFAFKQYAPRKLNLLAHLYSVAAVVAVVCILLARKHYTIDVVLGYLVSSRTFWTYHSLQNSYHNDKMEKNALSQSCWSWVVPYFEKDAPPPHLFLNRLVWPSSCPQRIRRRWA
ncbi:Sphingomyelin synthase-related 2 [Toxocara canis]|uniref:Sphingomyelin synthase-related 2 n=1 Tax=Toxocara canis TaxID=6265 RepID=A0A0B2UU33_TOXCA|nr:Sphingomyelin synthase-related 2 [Toxocara canis]